MKRLLALALLLAWPLVAQTPTPTPTPTIVLPSRYSLARQVKPGFGTFTTEATVNKLGDTYYATDARTFGRVAGNTTTTRKFWRQVGTGSLSAAPDWDTLVSGDIPNNAANTTGSAATLTTPRAINGVNFNGSAPITVTADANTLSGTTLKSTVVNSSLTSVGTLAGLTTTGDAVIGGGGAGPNVVAAGTHDSGTSFCFERYNSTYPYASITAGTTGHAANVGIAFQIRNAGTAAIAQYIDYLGKVGIGTTAPTQALDVNGKVGIRESSVTLANGANQNISVSGLTSWIKIVGPTAAFSIGGIAGGVEGQELTFWNGTFYAMTVNYNDAGSSGGNKIVFSPNADKVFGGSLGGAFTVRYDSISSMWIMVSHCD